MHFSLYHLFFNEVIQLIIHNGLQDENDKNRKYIFYTSELG